MYQIFKIYPTLEAQIADHAKLTQDKDILIEEYRLKIQNYQAENEMYKNKLQALENRIQELENPPATFDKKTGTFLSPDGQRFCSKCKTDHNKYTPLQELSRYDWKCKTCNTHYQNEQDIPTPVRKEHDPFNRKF